MRLFISTILVAVILLLGIQTTAEASPTSRKAYNIGKEYLGVNYKLGGHWAAHNWWRNGGGIDCSGLTMLAYERATGKRIHLPDDLGPLWNATTWRYERRRHLGDIVFYKENGSRYLTHVGIYAGKRNGVPYVLHASAYWGKVTIKPMRWKGDGFVGVRKVKGA